MKIGIKTKEKVYEINLQRVTQLIGKEIIQKEKILKSIQKHFTKEKYAEYEEELIENITKKDEPISKEFFLLINIANREEIISQLKNGKQTIYMQYLKEKMKEMKTEKEMYEIENIVNTIFDKINESIRSEIDKMKCEYMLEDIFGILSQSELVSLKEESLYHIDTHQLLKCLIKMIYKIYEKTSKKVLIICKNIDHMISKQEYKKIIELIYKETNEHIMFIFSSSVDNFVYVNKDTFSGINVINEKFFNVESYERIQQYLLSTYPCEFEENEEELNEKLELILNDVGCEENKNVFKAKILQNLINKALMVNEEKISALNSAEKAFIYS